MDFYRFYYPLGLASMAAVLEQDGHEVLVYDAEHSPDARSQTWIEASRNFAAYPAALKDDGHAVWSEIRSVLGEFDPDVAGISMLSVKTPSARKVAAICKQVKPGVPVVVGADHPTVFPEAALNDPHIDIVVRGEGERTLADLLRALEDGADLGGVGGIVFKENGGFRHAPPRALIRDLDSLPFPGIRNLLRPDTYRPLDFGAIMGSRGCPYPCTFCGVQAIWSRRVRYRSVGNVLSEIHWLHDTWKTDFFSFRDASFTLDRNRVTGICNRILADGLKIGWECTTRADLLDGEMWGLLKRSGCANIRLGVESGSEKILRSMKKNIDLDAIRKAAALLNRNGAYWSAYFLFGTPHETRETIRETMAFIEEIDPPFTTMARYAPIPGTEMYQELEKVGRVSPGIDWGLEANQHPGVGYALALESGEFEKIMQEAAVAIEQRNAKNTARMGVGDMRLKL